MRRSGLAVVATWIALLAASLAGCSEDRPTATTATARPAPADTRVAVRSMPAGVTDGAAWVKAQTEELGRAGRPALVYVGAEWCEPCKRFKAAAAAGQLDADLPGLVLLELDHGRDEAALAAMGCTSTMIPLLAVPDAEGRCTDRRLEGAIKGEGAVAWMTPKVQALLR